MSERTGLRWSTRAVLAAGILAGIVYVVETALTNSFQVGVASDVYLHTATALLEGGDVYEVTPPGREGYTYIYPPIVLLAFLPHALVGSETVAFAIQTVLNVAAGAGLGLVVVRALDRRGMSQMRVDRWLIVGFGVGSVYAATQVVQGQTTLWLALALAVGFEALEQGYEDGEIVDRRHQRIAGIAFALAALVKVFPAAVGLWLLRLRAWRGVGTAVVTGVGGIVAGALLFGPDLTVQYFAEVLLGRAEGATFEGTPDPERSLVTARRQIAALGVAPGLVTPITVALLAPVVLTTYRRIDTHRRRLAAMLATLVALLLAMPLQALYYSLLIYPLVLLLVLLPGGRVRWLLIAGIGLTFLSPGPDTVAVIAGPLPAGIESWAVAAAERAFTVVQLPTLGMWSMLGACVLVQFEVENGATEVKRDESSAGT